MPSLRSVGRALAGALVGAVVLLLWLLAWLWRRIGAGLLSRITDARHRRRESEAACFARFRRAARSGDPRATWNDGEPG